MNKSLETERGKMRCLMVFLCLLLVFPVNAAKSQTPAETIKPEAVSDYNDILQGLMDKSDLIVAGEVVLEGFDRGGLSYKNYFFDMQVSEVLFGDAEGMPDKITVSGRYAVSKDYYDSPDAAAGYGQRAHTQKGTKIIVFLKRAKEGETTFYNVADIWFGMQPYSGSMSHAIKETAQKTTVNFEKN